jgi:hypothetical protein
MLKYAAGGTASYRARLGSTLKICRASVNLVGLVGPQMPGHVATRLESQAAEKHLQAKEIRKVLERLEPFETD